MVSIEAAKARRDAALQSWRHQLNTIKVYEAGSPEWEKQRMVLDNALAEYRQASNDYMKMLVQVNHPKRGCG
jgi:hypothetical protein